MCSKRKYSDYAVHAAAMAHYILFTVNVPLILLTTSSLKHNDFRNAAFQKVIMSSDGTARMHFIMLSNEFLQTDLLMGKLRTPQK